MWALKANHILIYGRPVRCFTGALAVKKIFEEDKIRKRTPIRFIRWKAEISIYNVIFVHRSGETNAADFLSRRCKQLATHPIESPFDINQISTKIENDIDAHIESLLPTTFSLQQLKEAAANDPEQSTIRNLLHKDPKYWNRKERESVADYTKMGRNIVKPTWYFIKIG